MITTYKSNGHGLEVLATAVEGAWVSVVDPTPDELAQLIRDFGLPPEFAAYPLDVDEMPRTERDEGVTLIVVRVPSYQGETEDVPYVTLPLGILLAGKNVITVCKHESGVLRDLADGRRKGLSTTKRNRFVLQLLWSTANRYLAYLRDINRSVDRLEDRLQASLQNREVLALLKYQKSLVYFTTALKANEVMMERLQKSQLFQMYPDDLELLEDVLTENQQAIEMTAIASNILSSMMDAFASIISNNLNVVMKFLASITIILTIPTLIASLYGMNVGLPLEGQPWAFAFVLALAAGVAGLVGFIFWRKDWL
jgi:magnesium transporter